MSSPPSSTAPGPTPERDGMAAPAVLARTLSTLDVTLLGVGAIVGGGVFASIGTAAVGTAERPGAGPSLILSAGITALVCAFTAMCYSELASLVPTAGSAYAYGRLAFGQLAAWLIGWTLTLEYAVANVAVAVSWGNYMHALCGSMGINVPFWMATEWQTVMRHPDLRDAAPHVLGVPIAFNGFAALIIGILTWLLVRGMHESSRLNNFLVIFKILILGLFVFLGCKLASPGAMVQNWQPFFPNGMSGTLHGAAVIFFSYIGFDSIATVAEEVRNPRRSIPVGIMASLCICAVLYMAVAAVFTGLAPAGDIAQRLAGAESQPLTVALQLLGPRAAWANPVIAVGALVAQTTALLAFQVAQARIFFAMARDGLLPPIFSRVRSQVGTPHAATIIAGLLVGGWSMVASMEDMLDLTDIGTLAIFCLTCLAIPTLRRRFPERPRAFKVPGGAWLCPLLGAGSCALLMCHLPGRAWLQLALWLAGGLVIYATYGARRARAVQAQQSYVGSLAATEK